MNKTAIKTTVMVFFASLCLSATAQQKGFTVKEGQKLKVHTENFFVSLNEDDKKKMKKMKDPADKAKYINEINQIYLSGQKKNTFGFKVAADMLVEKVDKGEFGERMVTTMEAGGRKYRFVSAYKNDTFYFSRNSNPVFSVYQGDTIGFGIQGIKEIPANIQSGISLKRYYDYGVIFDKAVDVTLKKSVFSHMASKTTLERNTFGLDSRTGQFGFGDFRVTKTHAVYNTIDIAARQHLEGNSYTINYAVSDVGEKQPVTVHGKTYQAYVITSEQWVKSEAKFVFESEDKAVQKNTNTEAEKLASKARETQIKEGGLNSEGYVVTKYKEFYVPGVGVVRTELYEPNGLLKTVMTVEYL